MKWPSKKEIDYFSDEYQQMHNKGYCEGWNDAMDACKQFLNQASQEDREGLAEFIRWHFLNVEIYNGIEVTIAEAILKEYILVSRKKVDV